MSDLYNEHLKWNASLLEKYPLVFNGITPRSGIWVPEGWKDVVENICKELTGYFTETNISDYRVDQIKEKFWELRWYDNKPLNPDIQAIIGKYIAISSKICTKCGASANRYQSSDGRFHRLCETHINELGNK